MVSNLKKIFKCYKEKELSQGASVCKVTTDEESLLIIYFKNDNKFNSLVYNNMDSLHYERVYFDECKIELNITINNLDNLLKQKDLFNIVLEA